MAAAKEKLLPADDFPGWDTEELAVKLSGRLKGLAFFTVVTAGYLGAAVAGAPEGPLPPPSPARAAAECALALAILVELGVSTFLMPAPTKDQDVYPLMSIAGEATYLTVWILYFQSVHMLATAAAETLQACGVPCPRLVTFTHAAAVFIGTVGIMLTLLFLKFNYFEEKWQIEVRQLWERRGVPFGFYSLVEHVPSLPVGILDVLVRDRRFLRLCCPSLAANSAVVLAFSLLYFVWMHLLWWLTGYKCWPYPFLKDLDTLPKRLVLLVVIFISMMAVLAPLSLLV